jgi:FeS assembly SUF system regulator
MIILSKLADYGVIVACELAVRPERQVTAAVLAEEARLPRATVAKLLKALAHAGIVTGARGATGGYRLAHNAASVSVAEVVAAIDGAIGITQCTSHPAEARAVTCERTHFCPTRPHWQRINSAVATALGAVTLADMVAERLAFPFPAALGSGERLTP